MRKVLVSAVFFLISCESEEFKNPILGNWLEIELTEMWVDSTHTVKYDTSQLKAIHAYTKDLTGQVNFWNYSDEIWYIQSYPFTYEITPDSLFRTTSPHSSLPFVLHFEYYINKDTLMLLYHHDPDDESHVQTKYLNVSDQYVDQIEADFD